PTRRSSDLDGGHLAALAIRKGVRDRDALAPVGAQHPAVLWMRFLDVDDEKGHQASIPVVQLVKLPQLGAEGRSGVRAEDQRDGSLPGEVAEAHQLAGLAQG